MHAILADLIVSWLCSPQEREGSGHKICIGTQIYLKVKSTNRALAMQVPPPDKKQRKETLLSAELGKYVDKKVRVKFQGGREGKVYHVMYIITVENMNIVYTLDRKWVVDLATI